MKELQKKILVAVADYPDNHGSVALMYVHVRNKYYILHDIEVTVLNFAAKKDYIIDQIPVITLNSYKKEKKKYDVLVCHAANIRNHYLFLQRFGKAFSHLIFFFHGHEVLKINETYPKPYWYVKDHKLKRKLQDLYDRFKLQIWHRYLPMVAHKADYVFVSKWLYKEFVHFTRLSKTALKGHIHIINNSVGVIFEEKSYSFTRSKKYDFITIRNIMDDSKYGIDLVDELAKRNPQYHFLVIGRGDYYKKHTIPENVVWVDRFLFHKEMLDYIDQSRCGLLLTREDTQGVMTCELSTYGIPVITSNIDVCREICGELENVELIDNDLSKVNLAHTFEMLTGKKKLIKSDKFFYKNTVKREEKLIRGV